MIMSDGLEVCKGRSNGHAHSNGSTTNYLRLDGVVCVTPSGTNQWTELSIETDEIIVSDLIDSDLALHRNNVLSTAVMSMTTISIYCSVGVFLPPVPAE